MFTIWATMNTPNRVFDCRKSRWSRRELLRLGSLSLLGVTLPELMVRAAPSAERLATNDGFGRAKACILLFMWGGPAQEERTALQLALSSAF